VPGASARTNDVLAAAQRAELEALAQRGILAPDGMVLIPAGEFLMGTEDGLPDARPVHRVVLSSYWIDAYEVTNEQYRRCVKSGVCAPPKDRSAFDDAQQANHPVTNVTWSQARAFCQWNEKRLPTEAEWEKAARGTDGRRYPWGDAQGVIDAIVKQRTHNGEGRGGSVGVMPVGSFPQAASPYGVHELVGNVWEWVKDWYAEDFYATTPVHDPQGPLGGTFRVLRGGNWGENPLTLHAGHRGWDEMTYWGPALGFRCAADAS
jgi:formylglycine-generating enzyme required for sulfatase activity